MTEKWIPIGRFVHLLQVSRETVLRWEKKGYVKPRFIQRGAFGVRFFSLEDLEKMKKYLSLSQSERLAFKGEFIPLKGDINDKENGSA